MRPPYSEYAAPPIYVSPLPPRRGVQFSRVELTQLAVAVLALSAAFTVVNLNPLYGGIPDFRLGSAIANAAFLFLAAFVSVASGVGLHEIMHKVVAERYGHWAEFRYSLQGLLMAFVFAFLGFIFGAPGATYISGAVTLDQNGKISAAGPATNIVLGIAFFSLAVAVYPVALFGTAAGLAFIVFQYAASVNLILAGFNMIPVMPLDGAKVWRWNKAAWIVILALVAGILGVGWYLGYLFL
jgi:Zn-dependent protease